MLQMEPTECGAASLGIVLGYYKRHVTLEKLREDCGVTRDGSKAGNVIRAGATYGLIGKGYRKPALLLRELPLPLILLWDYNHFLVLEGYKNGRYCLNDPQSGVRSVDDVELVSHYSGIVLSLTPTNEFRPGGRRKSMLAAFAKRLAPYKKPLALAAFAGLMMTLLNFVTANFNQIFVDNIVNEMLMSWREPLLWSMVATGVFYGVLRTLNSAILVRQETAMSVTSSVQFFLHLLRLPISFFSQRFSGEIASRAQLNDSVSSTLTRDVVATLLNCFTAVFFLLLMLLYDRWVTSIAIIVALLNWILVKIAAKCQAGLSERVIMDQSKLMGMTLNGLTLIETIKASGIERDFLIKIAGYVTLNGNSRNRFNLVTVWFNPIFSALGTLAVGVLLCTGGMRVITGALTFGTLIALQSMMGNFLQPISALTSKLSTFRMAFSSINRLDDVLAAPVESPWKIDFPSGPSVLDIRIIDDDTDDTNEEKREKRRPDRLEGALEIRNMTFGYSKLSPPLIENFSISLRPGERVAFVGKSGSGKSTLSQLITGLLKPWNGEILIDGISLDKIPRRLFSNSVSFVDQNVVLYEGTVFENVTLWRDMPFDDVITACEDAACAAEILERPKGFDSIVEESGRNFSGGQRQRLDIARALATNPSILILDEATSALDTIAELHINQAIKKRGATCVIVAHRLSTIRDSDKIVVLENGKVMEQGTHEELMASGGYYRNLIEN
jgi:NHLM bacteriocin system ABC transporter peptidase/ATP-binding protein